MSRQILPNASALTAKLNEMRKESVRVVEQQMYKEAMMIFRASQKIVPVDTGALRSSGTVEGPKNGEVLIGYGGPAASYAAIVHEDLEARHKEGKTAKYLERPFMEALAAMDKRMGEAIERAIEDQPAPTGSEETNAPGETGGTTK